MVYYKGLKRFYRAFFYVFKLQFIPFDKDTKVAKRPLTGYCRFDCLP